MKHGIGVLLIGITASGCVTGEDGDGPTPGVLDRITCATGVAVSGTHIEGDNGPLPPAEGALSGCRPIGTWRFTVAPTGAAGLINPGDDEAVPACSDTGEMLSMYEFVVDFDATQPIEERYYDWLYTFVTPIDNGTNELKISSGGGGLCEGDFQLYPTTDGKTTIILRPTIEADPANPTQSTGRLIGAGTYEVHTQDQVLHPDEE